MNDKLTYQQARRLREQSLTSVLADQLILGEGYGSAIAKTISLKTKAKITGIKQKFDPLNIAKSLTGGSRLAPALLGRLLGRSERDMRYFAARIESAILTHPKEEDPSHVLFGAKVTVEDEEGALLTFEIVGEDEADLKLGLINISSPIARALIGKEEGDVAEVQAPGGVKRYEIVAVHYR